MEQFDIKAFEDDADAAANRYASLRREYEDLMRTGHVVTEPDILDHRLELAIARLDAIGYAMTMRAMSKIGLQTLVEDSSTVERVS